MSPSSPLSALRPLPLPAPLPASFLLTVARPHLGSRRHRGAVSFAARARLHRAWYSPAGEGRSGGSHCSGQPVWCLSGCCTRQTGCTRFLWSGLAATNSGLLRATQGHSTQRGVCRHTSWRGPRAHRTRSKHARHEGGVITTDARPKGRVHAPKLRELSHCRTPTASSGLAETRSPTYNGRPTPETKQQGKEGEEGMVLSHNLLTGAGAQSVALCWHLLRKGNRMQGRLLKKTAVPVNSLLKGKQ